MTLASTCASLMSQQPHGQGQFQSNDRTFDRRSLARNSDKISPLLLPRADLAHMGLWGNAVVELPYVRMIRFLPCTSMWVMLKYQAFFGTMGLLSPGSAFVTASIKRWLSSEQPYHRQIGKLCFVLSVGKPDIVIPACKNVATFCPIASLA